MPIFNQERDKKRYNRSRKRKLTIENEKLSLLYNREIFYLRIIADTINENGEPEMIELNFNAPFPDLPNFEMVPERYFKEFIQELFLEYQEKILKL